MSAENSERPYTEIGHRLRAARKALGYNQTDFAKRAGFTKGQVSNWEGGAHRPSLDACIAMRETYGLSIDFIIFGNMDALPHKIAKLLESSPSVNLSK
ncbi:transcriptional repressor DicA [Thalassovita gelatinovora]|uniref:Transcriptional repressor DicA n=1 Tax=Thalassovita gelatinovora TaxID=53501 RepID=A0A0P1FKJ9_THAGE|nr:helix-turn-helix transcriptional regulator [Thalassovita gelatinovora]QIZ79055.1 helix-turn-helix transcriptional regulator [Thalassovita gelatinovora]CUH68656.1 transcriptional repressor DicA [Thalassovita gelatinovora]SEQ56183.1 DNA-binding transcriptional regulator, XRE-family HTH domain [Thalassovita gelatinovora]